jgi:predicted DNA-binding protein (MmcQ/YjbR family)
VRGKVFAMRRSLHEAQRWSAWFKARPGLPEILVGGAPERFFVPPYVGHHGWVGACLDVEQDWEELADLIDESCQMTAPKRLGAELCA